MAINEESIKDAIEPINTVEMNIGFIIPFPLYRISQRIRAIEIRKKVIPQISGLACLALSFHNREPARKPDANIACCALPINFEIKYIDISEIIAKMQDRNRVMGSVSPMIFVQATIPHIGNGGLTNGVSPSDKYGA